MDEFGKSGEPRFAVVIGDVVGSRESPDRKDLQRRLLQAIEMLNTRLDGLPVPIALTAGDEIQALLLRPHQAVDLVVELSEAIFPQRFVFGLGYGGLSTELHGDVARIDGPSFHEARAALEESQGEDWLVARGFGSLEDALLTSFFRLMGAIRRRWTRKQLEYSRAARTQSQKQVAEERGVAPSTVSESLRASSFAAILAGEEAVTQLLRRFGSPTEFNSDSAGWAK